QWSDVLVQWVNGVAHTTTGTQATSTFTPGAVERYRFAIRARGSAGWSGWRTEEFPWGGASKAVAPTQTFRWGPRICRCRGHWSLTTITHAVGSSCAATCASAIATASSLVDTGGAMPAGTAEIAQ